MTWTFLLGVGITALVGIAWANLIDRAEVRKRRERAGLPVLGRDELVPRAVAIPTVYRNEHPEHWL